MVLDAAHFGVDAAFILDFPTHARIIHNDRIDWDDVKADTAYRFVKAMRAQGRELGEDIAATMDEEQALLQHCYNWSKGRAYEKHGVRRRRLVSDETTELIANADEIISYQSWEALAFEEIDEDWSGQYKERCANATPDQKRAIEIAKKALAYVEEGLPIPGKIRDAAYRLRKQTGIDLDLRLLAA
jgi:hypothetical protein